jgi:hypothetical protein
MKLKREIKALRKENKTAQDVIHNKEDAYLNDVQADTQDASAIIEKKD